MGLFDLFSSSNEKQAAEDLKGGLRRGEKRAAGAFQEGMEGFRTSYDDALAEYDPYTEAYEPAAGSYADALGLSGEEGTARSREAFETSPGYQFQLEQGQQALERSAARRGMLGSGNTSLDELEYSQGLASGEWNDYLDRLFQTSQAGREVAGSRANIHTRAGDQEYGAGRDLGTLYHGTETGIGEADAGYQMSQDATGANIFGAITGGLGLATKFLGMPTGGGTSLGAKLLGF